MGEPGPYCDLTPGRPGGLYRVGEGIFPPAFMSSGQNPEGWLSAFCFQSVLLSGIKWGYPDQNYVFAIAE